MNQFSESKLQGTQTFFLSNKLMILETIQNIKWLSRYESTHLALMNKLVKIESKFIRVIKKLIKNKSKMHYRVK